ncbi:amino acid dehydrogenase [Novosphingobium sp. G106]|uniref:Glu/Leu/Phe/Val dehydrogenase family protein n=1 Tax=Novosphingobium sp. G106 TaxID=2849500 RepID=UPI001C2DF0AB|nr:Glu/Leu/Phe/Val dehydrogenase dimerization domain-containing protein [Novosphingobium sp. G106]MBV1691387.1 amino acid dehydrogenase [Novosphingobium sp. G106]
MTDRRNIAEPPAEVIRLHNHQAKLEGVIVIHSALLGLSLGGCRVWPYPTIDEAFADAVRLAEGMSYKNAMAALPFGGAKAVIRRPEGDYDKAALFEAFGEAVDRLGGRYITAQDVGTCVSDMEHVAQRTGHVVGRPADGRLAGGDPSRWTALGVVHAMQAASRRVLSSELEGRTVAVQGLGHVGSELCRRLVEAGARLIVADIDRPRAEALANELGAGIADTADIALMHVDVFAPCALGGAITRKVANAMRARLICGAANNQLAAPDIAHDLAARGITYVPDYVANAGGIVSAAAEYMREDRSVVAGRVAGIGPRVSIILEEAARSKLPPLVIADRIAELIMRTGQAERL